MGQAVIIMPKQEYEDLPKFIIYDVLLHLKNNFGFCMLNEHKEVMDLDDATNYILENIQYSTYLSDVDFFNIYKKRKNESK